MNLEGMKWYDFDVSGHCRMISIIVEGWPDDF